MIEKLTDDEYFLLSKTKLCDSKYIDYIKSSIVSSKQLLYNLNPVPIDSKYCWYLRCYAYALGITYIKKFKTESSMPSIDNYYPGFTINNVFSYPKIDYLNILKLIKNDLENLQIEYRDISLGNKVILNDDEYIIKVFVSNMLQDFHFIRYYPKGNIWFHKMADNQPSIITKTEDVEFEKNGYGNEPKYIYNYNGCFKWAYEPVTRLVLKERKKILTK